MRKLFTILFILSCVFANAQFNPSIHVVVNDAIGQAQAAPLDGRTQFWDATNFIWRDFQNTTEVLTTLNLSKYRTGGEIILVDSGGTLNSNGTYTGGTRTYWTFRNGTADGNLVELSLFGGGSGGSGTLTNLTATNTPGFVWTITNATTTPNLSLASVLGGDISGASLNAVTVAKFNGQVPSYYLNYLNLFNTPTIPAQFNPIAGTNMSFTGTYPNITFNSTPGVTTAGVYMLLTSAGAVVNLDTANYRKVDSIYSVNDSVVNYVLNGVTHTLSIRGGTGAGGGGGSGTVTNFSFVNANGITGTVTNSTSIPALTLNLTNINPTTVNGLTLVAISNGVTITGGSGTPHTLTFTSNATVGGTNTGDVTLSGLTYLTITGQAITEGAIPLGTSVSGTLLAANFGALTGDVTNSAGSYGTTISANVVTYAKFQQVSADKILGNPTGSLANVSEIGLGTGLAFSGTNIVTAAIPNSALTNSSITFSSTDLSGSGSVSLGGTLTSNINANAVTYAKFQQVAASSLVGNPTGSLANAQGITLGYGLIFSGTTIVLDTAHLKDTVYAINGLSVYGTHMDSIGIGGTFFQNTHISGSNNYNLYWDSTIIFYTGPNYSTALALDTTDYKLMVRKISDGSTREMNWPSGGGGGSLATASGDASGTVSGTNLPLTLATVNSNVGTFGDATHVAQVTLNAKGLVTAGSSVAITGLITTLTTTGTSGPATYSAGTLNIPQYSGGGGGGLTVQRVTSGSSGTVTGSNYFYLIDPASTLAAYAATLPASPTDGQVVVFAFGGTLTSGTIVTALSILPNTSQGIIDNTPPTSATADNEIEYRWVVSNSKWYRFKP